MLGKDSIDFIVERLKFKTFGANDTICKIGDPGDEMFIIISGKVNICIYDENGENERVVATLGSGDYFGEMALLTGETRSASVITTEECETFVLDKKDFDVILEKFPSISLSMGKIVSKRLRETLQKSAISMPKDAPTGDGMQAGPSGDLKEVPLVDLISFCESNSITGKMVVDNPAGQGIFKFEHGQLQTVTLGDFKDDKALDQMIGWQEGAFKITLQPLKIGKDARHDDDADETRHILITNNSLVVRKIVERAFKGLGYEVTTAKNIADSMAIVNDKQVDIIISDIKLPDGSGDAFAEQVRTTAEVPFIFITDNSVRAEFEAKLSSIGKAALTKTHEVSEIVKLVENLI